MAKAILTFAVYRGTTIQRRETVAQDIVKVGKDPKSHLRVDDVMASRMHAVIEVGGPEDVTLIDLGNEPGTVVNGVRVNKCKLHVGDRIEVGGTTVVLEAASPGGERFASGPEASNPLAPSPATAGNPFGGTGPHPTAMSGRLSPFGGVGLSAMNPFAAGAAMTEAEVRAHELEVPADAEPGTYTFKLVKSGPAVSPDEVELPGVASVEIMILWGTNVLHVTHLTPPRPFYVGEEQGKHLPTDFLVPAERLGTTRMPIVVGDRTSLAVVIPSGAKGYVEVSGRPRMALEEARQHAQPSVEVSGGHQLGLGVGGKARIEMGELVFQVAAVNAGKPVPAGITAGFDTASATYFGLSFLAHAGLIAAMAFFVPPMGLTEEDGIDRSQLRLIQQFLNSAAEREMQQRETEDVAEEHADDREGGTGTRSIGEEGSMGNPISKASNRKYAIQGLKDNRDVHIGRDAVLREVSSFGMIGILNMGASGDPNAPTAPWGRDTSLGTDEVSARGNMWGDEIGDAFGAGGLGLSGIGEGGGGRGEGIGLGNIGTFGHGAGTGTGQGFGAGHGRLGPGHKTRPPQLRIGSTSVSGRLPPEVIQRIVRQNYGRFRMCYEQGLARNPNLEGRVSVRFVIGRDGSVSNVSQGASDLPDSGVVSCVLSAYYGLSFPQPEGGIVTVVYPIMFAPG
ncbi:MAG: AgmX/PglI C-terminal domain-containing protein [Polyangiaceae bacterium]|nr:AgmX/PglI C-terminal domain-containing protein [Polyangiaceae bacterium]